MTKPKFMPQQDNEQESYQHQMTFVELAKANRQEIKKVAEHVKLMKFHPGMHRADPAADGPDTEEMKSNVMLAYRHLEDAAMRLGKAIQAYDGGVSIYDK